MPVVAVSPIVAGAPIKGPAAPLMHAQGFAVSALGVAQRYRGLIDVLVIVDADRALRPAIEALGIAVVVTDTIMRGPAEKAALARVTLDAARHHAAGTHP
jgi:LPPG:FO 2-phospho-L-lactate transferase